MERKKRKKLCLHCEGEVDLDVIVCPYCGKDVSDQKMEPMQAPFSSKSSFVHSVSQGDESIASLYPPPYQPKTPDQPMISEGKVAMHSGEEVLSDEIEEEKTFAVLPILLFSLGINLFIVGLFSFAFSSHGEIWLHWKSHWWPLYVLFSTPLLILGLKKLS